MTSTSGASGAAGASEAVAASDDASDVPLPSPDAPLATSEGAELLARAHDATSELLELVLAERPKAVERVDGILVGHVVSLCPLVVRFDECEEVEARAFCDPAALAVGAAVALAFEGGRADRPLVLGKMARPAAAPTLTWAEVPSAPDPAVLAAPDPTTDVPATPTGAAKLDVRADGDRVEIAAERELVLRCGSASITLTKEGKLLLRGAYVSSRATGVHRIQGGVVEIN